MFENIGGKIKGLAQCVCWIGTIASIIGAIALWGANSNYNPTIGTGIVVLVVGCLGSWLGSFFTYAFGEIVENSEKQVSYIYQLLDEQKKTNKLLGNINK